MNQPGQHPINFVIHGQATPGGVATGSRRGGGEARRTLPGHVRAAVRLGALRAAAQPQRLSAVPGDDVVALHIAGGPVLLLHPENARDLLLAQNGAAVTRGAASGDVEVGAALRWRGLEQGTPTRGLLGDVMLAGVEILTGFTKDEAADFAAGQVVAKVDGQVEAGVYALAPDALPRLKGSGRRLVQVPAAGEPMLVLIHGTFVETTSTFGKLWAQHPQRVRQLFDHYGGRVYALEHETVGQSPVANALELVRALPQGARLHLATHSRGGLVAEVLARMAHQRAFGALDERHFPGAAYARHRQQLRELAAEMQARDVHVERVVRVACPARGTLLASKRLDAYLSVLKWAIEATGVPLVPAVVDFVAEVARRRADPTLLPGLAAMMPDTPLLNWLNAAPAQIAGELRVVAGDMEGDSLGSWLKTLLTDAYYWTDNDIVVQTRSMYAGAPRAGGASFLLDQGGKTDHFSYFINPRTVDAVVDGLLQPQPPAGFQTIGPLSWAGQDAGGLRARAAADPALPAVFVLPGILGSNLAADGHRVWLGLRLIGGLDDLAYTPGPQTRVAPDGPIGMVYDDLIDHLGASHEVIPFAYDWRLPIEDEARRLAAAVSAALDARAASGQPVRLLAHSMGGVLARCMQLEAPAVWQRLMAHPQARLLMLGTPNGGSWAPMQVLSGDDTFGNALAAFGSPLADHRARKIMAAMPGFLQLQAGLLDPTLKLDQQATWAALAKADFDFMQQANWWHRYAGEAMEAVYRWGVPAQAVLDAARALRQRLDAQREAVLPTYADKLLLVVGQAKATPVGYEQGANGFVYLDAGDGDGRVPLSSALLPGVATWQLDADHGSLPSKKKAFAAYVELLQQGRTSALPQLPATRGARGAAGLVRSRPSRTRQAARPAQSQRSVFGSTDEALFAPGSAAAGAAALELQILNGNLCFVAEPLLVGHYRTSSLTGTEAVIDGMVGGTLQAALSAGLYPDAVGTQQVFVNTRADPGNPWRKPRPQSVLVVGLGAEGELREAGLTLSVRQGVLAWAQRLAEARQPAPHALAATLLGSGGIGISAGTAARAIALGVAEANQRAAAAGWPTLSRLTLVEIYLDRATEAWAGLQLLTRAHGSVFALAPTIRSGTGPLRRQLDSGYRGADYDLISATTGEQGALDFVLDSRRARAEMRTQRTQTALLRELVRSAATDRNDAPRIGHTLFQLLVPPEIEPFLGGAERMVLDLDAGTAALPWELLDTGSTDGDDTRPWALRAQLLRRLRKPASPARPRDANADHDVLVIGEPLVTDPAYPPLPQAREEAATVQMALCGAGGLAPERVLALLDAADAQAVIGALLERPWRIIHIAGHGEAPSATQAGGVVLSGGHFLGPDEIGAMRTVPELVFVNCCHLAAYPEGQALRKGFDPGPFAAGVADQLIERGVRCVVACGWAVEDGPAAAFATTFYTRLLEGCRFIDAVAEARTACWAARPEGKSWAAYQCYGDAHWIYRSGTGDAQAPRSGRDESQDIASPPALALLLETMAVRARYMGADHALLATQLQQLAQRFDPLWGDIGAVAEAFAVAWQNLDQPALAIAWYQRALAANDGSASFKAEEQLLNLQARQAWAQASGSGEPADLAAQRAAVRTALAALQELAGRRPTPERLALLGSAWKRLALIERAAHQPEAEQAALREALAGYRQAEALSAQAGDLGRFRPALNAWALTLALGDAASFDAQAQEAALAAMQAQASEEPDFWNQVGQIEFRLLQALSQGKLAAAAPALSSALTELHRRHAAVRDWSSVADQAALVLAPRGQGENEQAQAARQLFEQLQAYARAQGPAAKLIAEPTA